VVIRNKGKLVPLGTNGFFPSCGRETASFLFVIDRRALVLDAGTGLSRLLQQDVRNVLNGCKSLNIILSHYHLDHTVGLSYLPGIWEGGVVRIYGPAPPFTDVGPQDALDRLLHPPLFTLTLQEFPSPVELVAVSEGEFEIDGLPLRVRGQDHPGGSIGIRIGDEIAYVTDTGVEKRTADFVRGVGLLLHEVWLTDDEAKSETVEASRHSNVSGVAEIAKLAGVGQFMPIHHRPTRSAVDLAAMARQIEALSGAATLVPEEGKVYHIR
jgi:ribonuclease BN (tRNA processing enzyme)